MIIPKHVGGDCELSTTGTGPNGEALRSWDVTKTILDHIDTAFLPHTTWSMPERGWGNGWYGGGWGAYSATDSNRHWAPNGSCHYCDLGKLECASAETLSARQYSAEQISNLLIAEAARQAAEAAAPVGTKFHLTAENVDPLDPSISWGTHFNVAVSRQLWEDLYLENRHPNVYSFVVSSLAAATVMFGSGYILPLKSGEIVYSLSARSHHLGRLTSLDTTRAFKRGITNSRRQGFSDQERQHLINFDFAPISARLRCCLVQMIFAAAENGFCGLNLFDPLNALRTWSFGLDLETGKLPEVALLADGRKMTLPQYMRQLATVLLDMVESGLVGEDVVPEAGELLPIIIELTHQLEAGALAQSAKHLDFCAKLMVLMSLSNNGTTTLGDATTRLSSFDFTNTDRTRGWFWKLWDAGRVDPLVTRDDVQQALEAAPSNTRAWGRGALISKFHDSVTAVDWDHVELRREGVTSRWGQHVKIALSRIESLNRVEFEQILTEARSVDELEDLLEQRDFVHQTDPAMDITSQLALPGPSDDDNSADDSAQSSRLEYN